MSKIKYVVGDVREQPFDSALRLIPHVCNNEGKMGKGVAKALYSKWPSVKKQYLSTFNDMEGVVELGETIPVRVSADTIVFNMIAQRGIASKQDKNGRHVCIDGRPPIRYAALMRSMESIKNSKNIYEDVEIHCPLFGCGLAGGDWSVIESMIEEIWCPLFTVKVCVLNKSEIPT